MHDGEHENGAGDAEGGGETGDEKMREDVARRHPSPLNLDSVDQPKLLVQPICRGNFCHILIDVLEQLYCLRLVLDLLEASDELPIVRHVLPTREVLHVVRLEESAHGLQLLVALVVWGIYGHLLQTVCDDLEQLPASTTRVPSLVLFDQMRRALEGLAELRHCDGPDPVRAKVCEADWNDLHRSALCGCTESHDGHAGLERNEMALVVASSFRKDSNRPILAKHIVHLLEDGGLVDLGKQLERTTLRGEVVVERRTRLLQRKLCVGNGGTGDHKLSLPALDAGKLASLLEGLPADSLGESRSQADRLGSAVLINLNANNSALRLYSNILRPLDRNGTQSLGHVADVRSIVRLLRNHKGNGSG
mmetsp:Transcript_21910/g.45638  ORF Transcript_21910/g.45638 Transcript_21910/m.45638 type:complete len:363 (+) Transcript_21910:481-1569(+)